MNRIIFENRILFRTFRYPAGSGSGNSACAAPATGPLTFEPLALWA